MSTNLYWRPVPQGDKLVGYDIKFHLAPILWGTDGSVVEDWSTVGKNIIPFLQGIMSVAAQGSDLHEQSAKLIKFIQDNEEVQLCIN